MLKIYYLLVGGIFGTLSRYGLTLLATRLWGSVLPVGTFIVNITGCFLAGYLVALAETRMIFTAELRLLLFTGFFGAFTTFSALIIETDYLYRSQNLLLPILNITLNLICGFLLFRAGLFLGK